MLVEELTGRVLAAGSPAEAERRARFFTTPGALVGVRVPVLRAIAREVRGRATVDDAVGLLRSEWHEVRLLAALLLNDLYRREPGAVVDTVLVNTERFDNWDLVDTVAPCTLGLWLVGHDRSVLDTLIASELIWERRMAIVATFALIRAGSFDDTLRLAARVLGDPEDLIHKATGWMLREVGNRDRPALNGFLDEHAKAMPRVMLRYAIEKHTPEERRRYLA